MNWKLQLTAWVCFGLGGMASAQTPVPPALPPEVAATLPAVPAKLAFDVASIRQNLTDDRATSNVPLGPGERFRPTHGVFSGSNQPIATYLMFAYKMTDHEVDSLAKTLPAWALEEHYDIEAKTERETATKDDLREMVKALLADRLKLQLHTANEDVPVYALVLAKPGKFGPGLRLHPEDDPCSNAKPIVEEGKKPPPMTVKGNFPSVCGGMASMEPSAEGRQRVGFRNVPLSQIAIQMTSLGGLDRPVVDTTEITGNVDFAIEFAPPGDDTTADGPDFRKALLEQTGLKLVPQKGPVDVIVIDHIERPTAN